MNLRAVVAGLIDRDRSVDAVLSDVSEVAELLAVGRVVLRTGGADVRAVLAHGGAVVGSAGALADGRPVVGAGLRDAGVGGGRVGLSDGGLLRKAGLIDRRVVE